VIGIDVVDVERLGSALARSPGLERRLFSSEEIEYCRRKADPIPHLAGTLAAKEAVIKSMRLGPLVAWSRRIEISRDNGVPSARVGDKSVEISISHDGGIATAIAVSLGDGR
jgi:holo-[acyl-carrier protein] synthase